MNEDRWKNRYDRLDVAVTLTRAVLNTVGNSYEILSTEQIQELRQELHEMVDQVCDDLPVRSKP